MKKLLSVIIALFMLIQINIVAFAADGCDISGKNVSVAVGNRVEIPVTISSNSGIMGFRLTVKYDSDKVDIKAVSRGDITSNGNFSTNFGINDGVFDILWNNTEELKEDGTLFKLTITAKEKLKDNSTILISFNQRDTFNEQYEDVYFNCKNITVTKSNAPTTDPGAIELPDLPIEDTTTELTSQEHSSDAKKPTENSSVGSNSGIQDTIKDVLNEMNVPSAEKIPNEKREEFVNSVKEKLKEKNGDTPSILDDLETDDAFEILKGIEKQNAQSSENDKYTKTRTNTIIVCSSVAVIIITVIILLSIMYKKKKTN